MGLIIRFPSSRKYRGGVPGQESKRVNTYFAVGFLGGSAQMAMMTII